MSRTLAQSAALIAALAFISPVHAQETTAHPAFETQPYEATWSAEEKVANALSAMPAFMAETATVWDWQTDAEGAFIVLKEGDGVWTCFPDRPQTPSNDPMCHDPVFLEWMLANATGRPAQIETVGLSYMLQGGSAFTQDSPFVAGPFESDDWYYMGPHVMVVLPNASDWASVNTDTSTGHPVTEALALDHPILLFPVAAPDEAITVEALSSGSARQ